jgi:glycosyltransferase involved in cell wall biosynthesis
MSGLPLVSIVIPARNEEGNIPALEHELEAVLGGLPYRFEFIVVDNASTDRTGELVKAICARDSRWRYLRFSRDFTVDSSITAGYHYAKGDAIVVVYSDLQDPPSVIPQFLEKWQEGYDVVYGVRTVRPGDPAWRNLAVKYAYSLIAWFSDVAIPKNTGDFRLITSQVRDALAECGEYNRYVRGLIAWLGFRQGPVYYERRPRVTGESKAPFWHTAIFLINAVTSFSLRPLRLFSLLGMALICLSLLAIPIYTVLFFVGHAPAGITTLILLAFLGIGINSLGVGILGEYLGRTYAEVKKRPIYIVKESVNFEGNV